MKKRILSTLLALTLCLGLLPTSALAAGNRYGPDDDGWGYTTSEKVIDLGRSPMMGQKRPSAAVLSSPLRTPVPRP